MRVFYDESIYAISRVDYNLEKKQLRLFFIHNQLYNDIISDRIYVTCDSESLTMNIFYSLLRNGYYDLNMARIEKVDFIKIKGIV